MSAAAGVGVDRAGVLVRALGAAIAARRLYDQGHAHVEACVATFLQELRASMEDAGTRTFRLTASGHRLRHDGETVRSAEGAETILAQILEEKNIGGLSFTADLAEYVFRALLDWFASRRAMGVPEGEWPGLQILPSGCGDDPQERPEGEDVTGIPEFAAAYEIHGRACRVLEGLMQDVRARRPMDVRDLADLVEGVAEAAWSEKTRLVAPCQLQRDEAHPVQHAVHVFLTATTLLQPLSADPRQLARLCMAALLHDVGKALVPREILHKKGRLGAAEWDLLRAHPERGAELLSKVRHLDTLACEVAYSHHMRDDGLGFPVPSMPLRPSPIARIVQAADLLEALACARPHSAGLGTDGAVRAMLALPGLAGRGPEAALLAGWLTPSPPGSEVRLAGGARAIVVDTDPQRPHHPVVRMHRDADGRAIRDPETVDLVEAAGGDMRPVVDVYLKPALLRTGREPSVLDRTLGEDNKAPAGADAEA